MLKTLVRQERCYLAGTPLVNVDGRLSLLVRDYSAAFIVSSEFFNSHNFCSPVNNKKTYCVKHENVMVEKSFISTEWQVCINSSAAKNDPWFAVRHHEMLDSIEQDCYSNYRCNLIIPVIGAYQVICKIYCLLSRKNF